MDLHNIQLLLSGGITRTLGNVLGVGHRSKLGELALLDWNSKKIKTLIKYQTPNDYCADMLPSVLFTSASLQGGFLYLCSTTQVFVYKYPSLDLVFEINHPYFNDVHHVTKIGEIIYVASTGIDAVLGFNESGELIDSIHSLGKDLWFRRSSDVDYRKIASTKPHDSHPNFVFNIGKDIWATRFEQKDAVNLSNFDERIEIDIERPHDGHVIGDKVYFTTVNGCIVIANINTKKVNKIIDLNEIDTRDRALGWCRGLAIIDNYAFVGFSKLRSTKIEKNIRWVKSIAKSGKSFKEALPARIALYNLKERKLINEFVFPDESMSIVFSVIPVSDKNT